MPTLLLLAAFLACSNSTEVTYTQFNGTDDTVTIKVGVAELLDPVSADLTSTTGEVIVGHFDVDPGGGPIGTEHAIVVEVYDAYQQIVDRVSVRLDSGARGEDEFELEQDSADEGVWKLSIVSAGDTNEVRDDTLNVRCWDQDGDTGAQVGTTTNTSTNTSTSTDTASDTGT
ncbi:MAG: hypothetical protein GXP62_01805 [Oligoflexia bacterium]|nr:hypothetical protein [Oligoflexia bacterium]